MNIVKAIVDMFVGHGGRTVLLSSGDAYHAEHPLVVAHPEYFTAPDAVAPEPAASEPVEPGTPSPEVVEPTPSPSEQSAISAPGPAPDPAPASVPLSAVTGAPIARKRATKRV